MITLQDIIEEHNIKDYAIWSRENIIDDLLKNLSKAKYVEQIDYWYDDEENPTLNTWCDIEGIGYGWIWCATELRAKCKWLQVRAVKKYIKNCLKELRDDEQIMEYWTKSGDHCYDYLVNERHYTAIILSDEELYWLQEVLR